MAAVGYTASFALYITATSSAAAPGLMRPAGKVPFEAFCLRMKTSSPYSIPTHEICLEMPGRPWNSSRTNSADPKQCWVVAGYQEAPTTTTTNIFLNRWAASPQLNVGVMQALLKAYCVGWEKRENHRLKIGGGGVKPSVTTSEGAINRKRETKPV